MHEIASSGAKNQLDQPLIKFLGVHSPVTVVLMAHMRAAHLIRKHPGGRAFACSFSLLARRPNHMTF